MPRADRPRMQGGARPSFEGVAQHGQTRAGRPDEVHLDSLALDPFLRLTLSLLRWHFQTFAEPAGHGWLMALRVAASNVGPARAGALCYDVVALVQILRGVRRSPVSFNSEACACCRVWLTPDERRLIEILVQLRKGNLRHARLPAQLLCDGMINEELLAGCENYLDAQDRQTTGAC